MTWRESKQAVQQAGVSDDERESAKGRRGLRDLANLFAVD
jgi:hypothetical protein